MRPQTQPPSKPQQRTPPSPREDSFSLVYKAGSSANVAKTVALLDPSSRGFHTRLKVLQCLAGSELPLSAREVSMRTGIPGRTVRYHLAQLSQLGFVWRSNARRRAPDTVYAVTDAGLEALKHMLLNLNSGHQGSNSRHTGSKLRGLGGGGVLSGVGVGFGGGRGGFDGGGRGSAGGGGGCGSGGGLRVWVEWQQMSPYHGEVGFRIERRGFARVFRWFSRLCGYRVRGRLRRVMVYQGRGAVHVDVVVRAGEAVRAFRLGFDGVLLLCLPSLFKAWVALSLLLVGVAFKALVKAARLSLVELAGLRVRGVVPA